MIKRISSITIVIFLLAFTCSYVSADVIAKPTYNRYNIVLVVDASGSMRSTDGSGLRFDAIGKFIALLAEQGNRISTVVFSTDIVYNQPLVDANGVSIKQQIAKDTSMAEVGGWTNIGLALNTAIDNLEQGKNPDMPSVILFFSDGNTEMPTEEETNQSLIQKAEAIQRARESGYKIHTICLNANGNANTVELEQIANSTGGLFEEITDSSDIENVFNMYYGFIYNSLFSNNNLYTFPETGKIEGTFRIPSVGVEELNVILSGSPIDYSLTDPNMKNLSKEYLTEFTYFSDRYKVIKMTKPVSGDWFYSITGIPNDKIQINLIYNTDLTAKIYKPEKSDYSLGEPVRISLELLELAAPVAIERYSDFSATLYISNRQSTVQESIMEIDSKGFFYEFTPGQSGSYSIRAVIEGEGYFIETENITLNYNNTPPVPNKDIKHKVYIIPFLEKETVINLSSGAIDPMGRELHYEVLSSSFNADEYTINGMELTMHSYSLSKGSFEIIAFDPEGGSCVFNVIVSTVNITFWGAVFVGGAVLVTIIIFATITWLLLNKRFYGTCYVRQFDDNGNYYDEVSKGPKRGRLYLKSFNINNAGFNVNKFYFQATGKRDIILLTNKSVYGNGSQGKKFVINGDGYEVDIRKDRNATTGIKVRFVSNRAH